MPNTNYNAEFMLDEYSNLLQDSEAAKERVRWAINYAAQEYGLTNKKLAEIIGCATSTINSYRRKVTLPGLEFFVVFLYQYGFILDWFVTGRGEPFPGARDKYPEVCGPEEEPIVSSIPQATARSGAPVVDPQAFQIDLGEDVRLAIEVLSSGTHYASSLHMNIRSFAAAVTDNKRLTVLEETQRQLEVKINSMESRMEEMIVQNKALLAEVNRLKATYEDPDGGNGSLTNTSGND